MDRLGIVLRHCSECGRKARAAGCVSGLVLRSDGRLDAKELTKAPQPSGRYSSAHIDVRRGNGVVVMALDVVGQRFSRPTSQAKTTRASRGRGAT
jgi:hypothetical protein